MKRKITYIFLTILLFGLLCFGLYFILGIFTPFNFLVAKQDIKRGKYQIAQVGEIPINFELKQKIANSYGFNYYLVGCNVSKGEIAGIEYYNKTMVKYLESRYGIGWWQIFQTKLDSIVKSSLTSLTLEKVLNLVEKQKNVKDQIKLIDSLSKSQRHISILPTLSDTLKNIYLVKVGEDNGINLVIFYNFLVDANSMIILNPDGKLEGQ